MHKHGPQDIRASRTKPSLRVCLIAGNDRTMHCGVKDYAHRLAEALCERGVAAEVHAPADWSLPSFQRFRRTLMADHFDVVHVQYPSVGFRHSLLPHLLGITGVAPSACVTLHEYSRLPKAQRWLTHLFRLSSKMFVFSTGEERASFEALGGSLGQKSAIIPIGSNLPVAAQPQARSDSVVYFGQIRPDKGVEAFLELARLSSERGRCFQFAVLGASMPKHGEYVAKLRERSVETVEWRLNQPSGAVAGQIAAALAGYLPFPDGASFRRGSLIAALVNGTPVITTISPATPIELRQALLAASSAEEALAQLDRLDASAGLQAKLSERGRTLGSRFSWASIAEAHESLYAGFSGSVRGRAERASDGPQLRVEHPKSVSQPKFMLHKD